MTQEYSGFTVRRDEKFEKYTSTGVLGGLSEDVPREVPGAPWPA